MYTSKAIFVFAASSMFIGGDAFRKKKVIEESSFTQTDADKIATQESMASRNQNHFETLSNLQTLARQVVSGEEKITNTSKLALASIEAEMLAIIDDTAKQHTENQEGVDYARDAIRFCGTETIEKHTKASGINEQRKNVDEVRAEHNECRIMETSTLTDKADKCGAFQTYNDNLSPPSCAASFPDGPSDSRLECISKLKAWSTQHELEYQEKQKLCDDATLLHDQTKQGCDKGQGMFEEGFCTFASTLNEACESQSRCRTKFLSVRDRSHSQVQVAENGLKAEYKSAKMIQCLLNVLRATAAEMRGQLTLCEGLTVDTSSLDIVYPAIPAAAACDPSPVASKPCGDSWINKEYASQADWYDFTQANEKVQPSSCVACQRLVVDKLEEGGAGAHTIDAEPLSTIDNSPGVHGNGKPNLQECQGDCDSNEDCAGAMHCFQRHGDEPMPGCAGTPNINWDYCYRLKAHDGRAIIDNGPGVHGNGKPNLQECQGDCDSNTDCAEGLHCYQRAGDVPMPGCGGSPNTNWDYCYPLAHDGPATIDNGPGVHGQGKPNLQECQGDCDSNADCAGELQCYQRTDEPMPGCAGTPTKNWDYCHRP